MEQHKFTEIQSSDHLQDSLYSKQCWGNCISTCLRLKWDSDFSIWKKNYCKWTKDFNGRSEALIFLERKARQTLQDIIISSWMRFKLLRQWLQPLTVRAQELLPPCSGHMPSSLSTLHLLQRADGMPRFSPSLLSWLTNSSHFLCYVGIHYILTEVSGLGHLLTNHLVIS